MIDKDISKIIIDAFEDKSVNMDFQVTAYVELMKKLRDDVSISPISRCAFESYYGMTQARLDEKWRNRYFERLGEYLKQPKEVRNNLTFERLMNEVEPFKDKNLPSFVSKMLHTLNTDKQIYDLHVRNFLKAGDPKATYGTNLKEAAVEIYEKNIRPFYDDEKYEQLRNLMLETFDDWYGKKCYDAEAAIGRYLGNDSDYNVSKTKKLDFVIWALGKRKWKISEFKDVIFT